MSTDSPNSPSMPTGDGQSAQSSRAEESRQRREHYVLRTIEERGVRLIRLWFTNVLGQHTVSYTHLTLPTTPYV